MTSETSTEAERLESIRELLSEIANGIRIAQESLFESENLANTAYLLTHSLGRLGWLADQGCVVAGEDFPPVLGNERAWFKSPMETEEGRLGASTRPAKGTRPGSGQPRRGKDARAAGGAG